MQDISFQQSSNSTEFPFRIPQFFVPNVLRCYSSTAISCHDWQDLASNENQINLVRHAFLFLKRTALLLDILSVTE